MVQRRCRLRLALKSSSSRRVGHNFGEKHDGYAPIELGVETEKHHAHSAFTELRLDPICTDLSAGECAHNISNVKGL
jgi:hypothetical protein